MFRRLNFLLPNAKLAQNIVNELYDLGVKDKYIHTYSKNKIPTGLLNPASKNVAKDEAKIVEDMFWQGNLFIFFLFLGVCMLALFYQQYFLSLLSVGAMILSFTAGNFFVNHIPHTHINEFKNALSHNELLMMVDIPDERVAFIEDEIHRHHPAAVEGGSSWALNGVDI